MPILIGTLLWSKVFRKKEDMPLSVPSFLYLSLPFSPHSTFISYSTYGNACSVNRLIIFILIESEFLHLLLKVVSIIAINAALQKYILTENQKKMVEVRVSHSVLHLVAQWHLTVQRVSWAITALCPRCKKQVFLHRYPALHSIVIFFWRPVPIAENKQWRESRHCEDPAALSPLLCEMTFHWHYARSFLHHSDFRWN